MINVIDELCAFTGLPRETVEARAIRREPPWPDHCKEWELFAPRTPEEVEWFYRTSSTYLFSNARHVCPPVLLEMIPRSSLVLDFGGGAGNVSYALAEQNVCRVIYHDLNELQRAFVSFVACRHRVDFSVPATSENTVAFSLGSWLITWKLDAVIALDVFEHIREYPRYIEETSRHMRIGAKMFVIAPFGTDEPSHIVDVHGFEEVCAWEGLKYTETVDRVRIYRKETDK